MFDKNLDRARFSLEDIPDPIQREKVRLELKALDEAPITKQDMVEAQKDHASMVAHELNQIPRDEHGEITYIHVLHALSNASFQLEYVKDEDSIAGLAFFDALENDFTIPERED